MRGVNLRRAASSDAAAASSPSDSEDDAAAKSGRLESDSEFSDRRSGGMGGIPAGGAGPPPPAGAKGTSSSAVKSIVAACSVRASCCSITASRHARRPSSSVASSPTARSSRAVRLPIVVGVAALTHATQGTECLSRLAIEVNQVQKSSCTQPCCRLRFAGSHWWRASSSRVPASAARCLARVQLRALQSTLKHALPWHNNATRPARSPASAAAERFTQEQHAVDAP